MAAAEAAVVSLLSALLTSKGLPARIVLYKAAIPIPGS
jgi:hypothetical protein